MTSIEWTDATWNPIVGCSIVSPGCTNCYAMKMARRIEAMGSAPHYRGTTKVVNGKPVWTGKITLAPDATLLAPWRRKKPTMYFVNSMSDLFHEDVPNEWIDRVFAVMALTPQHTYQVLTKRSARMRAYLSDVSGSQIGRGGLHLRVAQQLELLGVDAAPSRVKAFMPFRNVWLGVSAERQKEADERIPDLLDTPAAVRFVSAEPLLGPIDFTNLVVSDGIKRDALQGWRAVRYAPGHYEHAPHHPGTHLDWVIVGGESGPGARPFDVEWARSIISQCKGGDVACFVKQLGANVTGMPWPGTGIVTDKWKLASKKGGDPAEWPDDLRVREMPRAVAAQEVAA